MSRRLPVLGLMLLVACARPPAPLTPPIPAGLEGLDPPVREQYEALRASLERRLDSAPAWGDLGLWFDAYEQWDAAAACYGEALRLSRAPAWLEQLAHAERLRGDAPRARVLFADYLALAPRAVPARVWLAELELEDDEGAAARRLFEEALRLSPGHARARAGLARIAHREGELVRAIELLELALKDQPDSGVLHHLLGLALRDAGERARAVEHLEIAAAQGAALRPVAMEDPRRAEVAALRSGARAEARRAGTALREGRHDEALARLEDARVASPDDATAALNLARAQARLGDPQAAIHTVNELLAREPGHAGALELRALARSLVGDEPAALSDLRAALAADDSRVSAHRQVGRLLWARGEVLASLPHWERVCELEPSDAQARYRRAEGATHAERWAEAIAWLEGDVEQLEHAAAFRHLLARALAVAPPPLRDSPRALRLARTEHERRPNLREAETVAIAFAGGADFEAALRWQGAALEAVTKASASERFPWVSERLALFRSGSQEPRPFREGEGRDGLPVPAP